MSNWHPDIMYDVVAAQQREQIARAEAARRVTEALGARPPRATHRVRRYLAAALRALAARVAPPRERAGRRRPRVEAGRA